jgi:cytochrome bd-type quinol oxidase subunit 1
MVKKDGENSAEHLRSHSSFIISILGIVFAVFNPLAGVVLGIIGLSQSVKQKDAISLKAKKMSIIAIVVGVIVLILSIIAATAGYLSDIAIQ